MSASASAVRSRESAATRSAHSGGRRRYLRTLARLGYAAHGVVYGLVGVLALDAAVRGGSAEGGREAMAILGGGVIGSILLGALAVRGWQVIEPERPDAKGVAKRVGHLVSVIIHLGLAFYALSLAFGWFVGNGGGGGGGGGGEQNVVDITGYVMRWPGGRFVIAGVGIGVLIAAFWHLKNAVKADFMDELEVGDKSRWVRPMGQAGFGASSSCFWWSADFCCSPHGRRSRRRPADSAARCRPSSNRCSGEFCSASWRWACWPSPQRAWCRRATRRM